MVSFNKNAIRKSVWCTYVCYLLGLVLVHCLGPTLHSGGMSSSHHTINVAQVPDTRMSTWAIRVLGPALNVGLVQFAIGLFCDLCSQHIVLAIHALVLCVLLDYLQSESGVLLSEGCIEYAVIDRQKDDLLARESSVAQLVELFDQS